MQFRYHRCRHDICPKFYTTGFYTVKVHNLRHCSTKQRKCIWYQLFRHLGLEISVLITREIMLFLEKFIALAKFHTATGRDSSDKSYLCPSYAWFAILCANLFLLDPFYRRGRVYKRKFCLCVCLSVCLWICPSSLFPSSNIQWFDDLDHANHIFSESSSCWQPILPCSDPVPPSNNQYRPLLTQYPMIWWFGPCKPNVFWKHITLATSTALFWSRITKYRPVPS